MAKSFKARKHDEDFKTLLRKALTMNEETGEIRLRGIYANLCMNFGWKGNLIVIPYSHVVWFAKYGDWPKDGMHIDHINDEALDNRPCNLQEITEEDNQKKRRGKRIYRSYGTGKYGYGLYLNHDKRDNRYYVTRHLSRGHGNGELKTIKKGLGGFNTLAEAEARIAEYIVEIKDKGLDYLPDVEKSMRKDSIDLNAALPRIRSLRSKGYTIRKIVEITGFSHTSIYNRIRDIDIDRRVTRVKPKKHRIRLNEN